MLSLCTRAVRYFSDLLCLLEVFAGANVMAVRIGAIVVERTDVWK
jgi:hypothetical protein